MTLGLLLKSTIARHPIGHTQNGDLCHDLRMYPIAATKRSHCQLLPTTVQAPANNLILYKPHKIYFYANLNYSRLYKFGIGRWQTRLEHVLIIVDSMKHVYYMLSHKSILFFQRLYHQLKRISPTLGAVVRYPFFHYFSNLCPLIVPKIDLNTN